MNPELICGLGIVLSTLDFHAMAAAPSPGPSRSVDAVIQRHIEAVSGGAALAGLHTQVSTFDLQEGDGTFVAEISYLPGGRLHLKATSPNGLVIRQAFDGQNHGWRQGPDHVRELDSAKDLMDFRELALCVAPAAIAELRQRFAKVELADDSSPGAALVATAADGSTMKLRFDADTGRLSAAGGSTLAEYQVEHGIVMPHLIRSENGASLKLKQVKFNVELPAAQFDKPTGGSAPPGSDWAEAQYATVLNPGTQTLIARRPPPVDFRRPARTSIPAYKQDSGRPFQIDLRGTDVSRALLEDRLEDLLHADFDSRTTWPARLPEGFAPDAIMTAGRNPGLGVRALHRRGVTGKGVGLAIIDQTLLAGHREYREQLRSYEEIHAPAGACAQMHGPAVASIAVGKTVGVAPDADLYYIAETHGVFQNGKFDWDFTWVAKSIDRILEINSALPPERRIRVISISVGWSSGQKGCEEADAAVRRATQANVFVVSTAIERTHKLAFHGLGRDPRRDPEKPGSYGPGSWWAGAFLGGQRRFAPGQRLLVPMDARTTASPTGEEDYVFYSSGGWSWSVPYIAGLYALVCQVHPAVTPETFWAAALKTGRVIEIEERGAKLELGTVVDPGALLDALR